MPQQIHEARVCPRCLRVYEDGSERCADDAAQLVSPIELRAREGELVDGRFRLGTLLGIGGVGAVYRATRPDGADLAIKLLRARAKSDETNARRMLREARVAIRLRHPHIVSIHDFGQDEEGRIFIAMEALEGVGLDQRMALDQPLDLAQSVELLCQAAEGLQAAHEQGLTHRDIKPGNLFLVDTPEGRLHLKLLDFGSAKPRFQDEQEAITRVGMVVGTPAYMSPEQATGKRVDGRGDVYSLAVIGFELLTGGLPFAAVDHGQVMTAHVRQAAPSLQSRLPSIPEALDRAVRKGLAKAPDARPVSARAFADGLRAALASMTPAERARPAGCWVLPEVDPDSLSGDTPAPLAHPPGTPRLRTGTRPSSNSVEVLRRSEPMPAPPSLGPSSPQRLSVRELAASQSAPSQPGASQSAPSQPGAPQSGATGRPRGAERQKPKSLHSAPERPKKKPVTPRFPSAGPAPAPPRRRRSRWWWWGLAALVAAALALLGWWGSVAWRG